MTFADALPSNAQYAYQKFQGMGYSPVQAAGLVGNLVQESGVTAGDGTNGGDGGRSNGVAQWNGSRLAGLYTYAQQQGTSPWNLDTQLGYVDHELKTTEQGAYANLMNAKTVPDATAAAIGYERPQGYTAANPAGGNGWANRLSAAQQVFGSSDAPAVVPVTPPATVADVLPQIAVNFGTPSPAAYAQTPGHTAGAAPDQSSLDQARRAALIRVSSTVLGL